MLSINCFFQITLEITRGFVLFKFMLYRANHLITNGSTVFTGKRQCATFSSFYGGHTVYVRGYLFSLLPLYVSMYPASIEFTNDSVHKKHIGKKTSLKISTEILLP